MPLSFHVFMKFTRCFKSSTHAPINKVKNNFFKLLCVDFYYEAVIFFFFFFIPKGFKDAKALFCQFCGTLLLNKDVAIDSKVSDMTTRPFKARSKSFKLFHISLSNPL